MKITEAYFIKFGLFQVFKKPRPLKRRENTLNSKRSLQKNTPISKRFLIYLKFDEISF